MTEVGRNLVLVEDEPQMRIGRARVGHRGQAPRKARAPPAAPEIMPHGPPCTPAAPAGRALPRAQAAGGGFVG